MRRSSFCDSFSQTLEEVLSERYFKVKSSQFSLIVTKPVLFVAVLLRTHQYFKTIDFSLQFFIFRGQIMLFSLQPVNFYLVVGLYPEDFLSENQLHLSFLPSELIPLLFSLLIDIKFASDNIFRSTKTDCSNCLTGIILLRNATSFFLSLAIRDNMSI